MELIGKAFRLNTATDDRQDHANITVLSNGGFVATWRSNQHEPEQGIGVFAQLFDESGSPVGTEFRLDSGLKDPCLYYSGALIVSLHDGGFLASWQPNYVENHVGEKVTYVRRFDASGNAVGVERLLALSENSYLWAAVGLADGSIAYLYDDWGNGDSVFARVETPDGTILTSEFLVDSVLQLGPHAVLSDGSIVVTWGVDGGVFAARFTADGSVIDAPIRVDAIAAGEQFNPSIAALARGGFVVTWKDETADQIFARIYDTDGTASSANIVVAGLSSPERYAGGSPDVAATHAGGFVVTWWAVTPDQDEGDYSRLLCVRAFDVSGAPVSGVEQVAVSYINQSGPVQLPDGDLIVAWTNAIANQDDADVYAQRFHLPGTVLVTLAGTAGADELSLAGLDPMRASGLAGDDTYLVRRPGDIVIEQANQGIDTVESSLSFTLVDNVEHLVLTGSRAISGHGNSLANRLTGNGAANALSGLDGNDTLSGGTGIDTLRGGAGNDRYIVLGADKLVELTNAGTDTVESPANWTLGDSLERLVLMGDGNASGTGNALANTITGNAGANLLSGRAADDVLQGRLGNDTLSGGSGADTLIGGAGDDVYEVDAGDVLSEKAGEGNDLVRSAVSRVLEPNIESFVLTGESVVDGTGNLGANTLTGNAAANQLSGLGGADTLVGTLGNDTLAGGLGNDSLNGGAGADVFLFDTALSASANVDQLFGFVAGSDMVSLADGVFGAFDASVSSTIQAGQFHAAAGAKAAHDADDRIVYDPTTGTLYYDADGAGGLVPVKFAVIGTDTHPQLGAGDFQIVG